MNKKIKKRIIIFGLIIAVGVMFSGVGENYVKNKIEKKLADKLDRNVSIKKLNFAWPNKIELIDVKISRHSDFGMGLACQLDKLYYDLCWRALKNQSMARASIKDGTFNIVILPDGRVNLLEFRKLRLKFEHLQIENLLLNFFLDNETETFISLPTQGQVWFNGCDRHIAWDIKSLALQTSGNSGLVKSYDSSQAGMKLNLILDNFNFN